jgi:hypothetical protein
VQIAERAEGTGKELGASAGDRGNLCWELGTSGVGNGDLDGCVDELLRLLLPASASTLHPTVPRYLGTWVH